ncbi:MAG: hypothetical protein M1835_004949 [Candelina submexicana]|nr:MAG: hypothetical protein M1835_004949 [Candelina submexicana]
MSPYKGWDEGTVRRKRGASELDEATSPTRKRVVHGSTSIPPTQTTSFTPINLTSSQPDSVANGAQVYIHPGFAKLSSPNGRHTTLHTPARKKATPASQLSTPPATDEKVSKSCKITAKEQQALSAALPMTKPTGKPAKATGKDVFLETSIDGVATPRQKIDDVELESFHLDRNTVNKLASFRYQVKPRTNAAGQQGHFGPPTSAAYTESEIIPDNISPGTVQNQCSGASKVQFHSGTTAQVKDVSKEGVQGALEKIQSSAPQDDFQAPGPSRPSCGSPTRVLRSTEPAFAFGNEWVAQPKSFQQDHRILSAADLHGQLIITSPKHLQHASSCHEKASCPSVGPSTKASRAPLCRELELQNQHLRADPSLAVTQEQTVIDERPETSTDFLDDRDDEDFLTLFQAHSGPKYSTNELTNDEIIADGYMTDDFDKVQIGEHGGQNAHLLYDEPELADEHVYNSPEEPLMKQPSVDERFSPPSDLQYPFDEYFQTPEVDDNNLKGSTVLKQDPNVAYDNLEHTGSTDVMSLAHPSASSAPSQKDSIHDGDGVIASNRTASPQNEEDEDWALFDENKVCELLHLAAAVPDCEAGLSAHPEDWATQPQKIICSQPATTATLTSASHCGSLEWETNGSPKPFVRPLFPKPIRDRSPVLGVSSRILLRTCFRVGEALNAGCAAARTSQDVIVELYARVNFSYREAKGWKQHFQFSDLYHDRPPYLNGIYEGWRGIRLWEYDSSLFLGDEAKGRMCRCMGRIKRDEKTKTWILVVLNIWAAVWDDFAFVKGIVCA